MLEKDLDLLAAVTRAAEQPRIETKSVVASQPSLAGNQGLFDVVRNVGTPLDPEQP